MRLRRRRGSCESRSEGSGLRLTDVRPGQTVRVLAVDGGERVTLRLSDMGLFEGTELELLRANGHGPVMVRVGPSRLALGRGVAEKILVQPSGTER